MRWKLDLYTIRSRCRGVGGGRPYHAWRSIRDRRALQAAAGPPNAGQMQVPSHIAVLFIGTSRYVEYFASWHASLREHFLPGIPTTYFAFTDRCEEPALQAAEVRVVRATHHKFPRVNLLKYRIINSAAHELAGFSHVVYVDADMFAVRRVEPAAFFCHDRPLFAVCHYNAVRRAPVHAFEHRAISRAAVEPPDDLSTYWQACFWGGRADAFLALSRELEARTADDLGRGVTAKWWDESFLNKYLVDRKHAVHTYPPTYAWPTGKPLPRGCRITFEHRAGNPPALAHTSSIRDAVRRRAARAGPLR